MSDVVRPTPEVRAAPEVNTAAGRVRGFWRGGSAAFLGIPFAAPPVGDLRFAAPEPPLPWSGVRDATVPGPTPQRRPHSDVTLIPEPSIPGDATLNVDVFTPAPGDRDAGLPVLVWFHGGGFVAGSPASPWYDGAGFNRDGVVTVTVSYRLGFDGFGFIDDAANNRAVRDWLMALAWVRDTIRAFGGSPDRVTIAGQSAGGAAVLTLLGLPAAQELFHSAWCASAPLITVPRDRARAMARRLAALCGVAPTRAALAAVPEDRVLDLQDRVAASGRAGRLATARSLLENGLHYGPVVDGEIVRQPVLASLQQGVGADKPLVIGATDDEFSAVAGRLAGVLRRLPARTLLRLAGLRGHSASAYLSANSDTRSRGGAAMLGRYVTDRVFRTVVPRVAAARAGAAQAIAHTAAPTWLYRFSWPSPVTGLAGHCLDVPFFFDCLREPGVRVMAGDAPPQAVADAVHGAAVELARGGQVSWPQWTPDVPQARLFEAGTRGPATAVDGYASVRALLAET